ncbi:uncharacterized protein TNCV_2184641 [Trichonephila clavipes]|nr:uncharacterized protein TNCV_2184641 [Trichonephila clavipes]
MYSRRHEVVRSTTPAEDRYIVLSAKRNRCTTAQLVAKSVSCCLRKADLPKTVARRLRGGELYARRPVVCVPLTRQHRNRRLQWCLHVVANGTMKGQRYIDEVLLLMFVFFRGAVGDKFVFMDDNATCHRTLAVDCLGQARDVSRLEQRGVVRFLIAEGQFNADIYRQIVAVYEVAAVAEWYRHRIVAGFVTSSSPVPLKTRRVGQRCTLNLSRAETSFRWCGVVVRRGGCQLRCRPRHLTMVQNYVVRRQKPSCS